MKISHIAVDFDGTLARSWSLNPGDGSQNIFQKAVLFYIKRKQKQGVSIILNTLRTEPERLGKAVNFLEKKGFIPDFINENDPKRIEKNSKEPKKIDADLYIDDRNIGLLGWLLRTF